ncbi:MAG: hypothetical protein GXX85_16610 [Ignavibacteria bacterium]|nr:hypothetical protein [Ignavibacteria bacterium]
MVKRWILFCILAIICNTVSAQGIRVKASTDSSKYFVGDYIVYTLQTVYDSDIKIELPPVKDSIKTLDYIAAYKPVIEEDNGVITQINKYVFSKYDSAEVIIPQQIVKYQLKGIKKTLVTKSNEVKILVTTLPVQMSGEIKDVKSPITLPFNWLIVVIALWISLVLIGIYFIVKIFWWDKRKVQTAVTAEVKVFPHEAAINALNTLKNRKLWQSGKVKEYHTELTDIIRRYFEDRYYFSAMEMTSNEIMNKLRSKREAREIFDLVYDFFTNADLVKFAKFHPLASVNEEMMNQAYKIVEETKPSGVEIIEKPELTNVF